MDDFIFWTDPGAPTMPQVKIEYSIDGGSTLDFYIKYRPQPLELDFINGLFLM
jgi:hypothetical protein